MRSDEPTVTNTNGHENRRTPVPLTIDNLSTLLHRDLLADRIDAGKPGAVIAAYHNGELITTACAGLADLETGELLTEHTLMNIASVSKQMVAATILLAAERGQLDLDQDLRALVPELPLPGITVRHCLQHTAGLPDYLSVSEMIGIETLEIAGLDAFLTWLGTVERADFAPGERASYSNTGYVIAALAAERATETFFPELIADSVFRPLGMDHSLITTWIGQAVPTRHGMGIGEVKEETVRGVNGDGEVLTSLVDFARWHGFLIDGRVLGARIREQMLTRSVLVDGSVSTYGLGIEHEQRGGTNVYAHSGSMWAYASYSLTDPTTGIGIAVFANRDDLDATETAWSAYRLVAGQSAIAGHWFSEQAFDGLRLRVRGDGGLEANHRGEAARLVIAGAGRWTGDDDLSLVEISDDELSVALEFGLMQRFERLAPAEPHPAHVIGEYREPYRGATYRLEERDGDLWVLLPNGETTPVVPFGVREGQWIGSCASGWMVVGTGATDLVQFGSGPTRLDLQRS
jgi:CubicO group peptidase (beta-lactamase class C family)